MTRAEYPYDDVRVTVFLEHGLRFVFSVSDWGGDESHKTRDDEAQEMARGLVMDDHVFLHGTLYAPGITIEHGMLIDPARVVAIVAEPVSP